MTLNNITSFLKSQRGQITLFLLTITIASISIFISLNGLFSNSLEKQQKYFSKIKIFGDTTTTITYQINDNGDTLYNGNAHISVPGYYDLYCKMKNGQFHGVSTTEIAGTVRNQVKYCNFSKIFQNL